MAATAEILLNPDEIKKAMDCLVKKFPLLAKMPEPEQPMAVVKLTPKVISVLNSHRCRDCGDDVKVEDIIVCSFPPSPRSKHRMPDLQCLCGGDSLLCQDL